MVDWEPYFIQNNVNKTQNDSIRDRTCCMTDKSLHFIFCITMYFLSYHIEYYLLLANGGCARWLLLGVGPDEESDGRAGQRGGGRLALYRPEPGHGRDQGALWSCDRQEPQGVRVMVPDQGEMADLLYQEIQVMSFRNTDTGGFITPFKYTIWHVRQNFENMNIMMMLEWPLVMF